MNYQNYHLQIIKMGLIDYIISKDKEEINQFNGVVSCLNIFNSFPPDMTEKDIKKFIKRYGKLLEKRFSFNKK